MHPSRDGIPLGAFSQRSVGDDAAGLQACLLFAFTLHISDCAAADLPHLLPIQAEGTGDQPSLLVLASPDPFDLRWDYFGCGARQFALV
jgi:hypothetical protein